jgi:hypothetical protein
MVLHPATQHSHFCVLAVQARTQVAPSTPAASSATVAAVPHAQPQQSAPLPLRWGGVWDDHSWFADATGRGVTEIERVRSSAWCEAGDGDDGCSGGRGGGVCVCV